MLLCPLFMAYRFDFGEIKDPYTTEDGTLLAEATFCRDGVLNYKRSDGSIIREFRPPEENQRALAEMGLLPITIEHPSVGLLTADNANEFRKGMTLQNVRYGKGGFVRGDIAVWDGEAQQLIKSGDKRQTSLGYKCDIDNTPGVWVDSEGIAHPYDRRQVNLKPNHLCITSKGRAGAAVEVHIDSIADEEDIAIMQTQIEGTIAQPRHDAGCGCTTCQGGKKMDGEGMKKGKTVVIKMGDDDMEESYEVDSDMAKAMRKKLDGYKMKMDSLQSDLESKEETIAELQARIEELETIALENEGHYDSLRSEYEELVSRVDSDEDPEEDEEEDDEDDTEEEAIDLEALIQEAIEQRKAAFENVQELLPEGEEFDATLTPAQWNEKALELAGVGMDSEELDEATIAGIIKGLKLASTRTDSLRDRLNKNYRADSSVVRSDAEAARERMIEESRSYANKPLREILRGG